MSRFTVINESFTCQACGQEVPPLQTGCRNHCPFCLSSLHVDIMPGDRANPCGGLMRAVGYEPHPSKGLMLEFHCQKCGGRSRNKATIDHEPVPDDYQVILSLSKRSP